eukprot:1639954-Pyramimonas_sp.AAC.1
MAVVIVAMTTARTTAAPMSTAPADDDDGALASATKVLVGVRRARAADAREWPAFLPARRTPPYKTNNSARARELA